LRQAEARPARLDKNQVVWVQPGGAIREDFGYQSIRVFDAPSRTDMAIIAAVTVAHADHIQPPSRVQKAIPLIERMYDALSFSEYSPLKTLESMPEELSLTEPVPFKTMEEALESLKPLLEEPQFKGTSIDDLQPEVVQTLAYAKDLLRHYRADLDELPLEEQINLMQHTCQRINAVLEAVRKLVEFAEHGSPSGDSKPSVKQAIRDVKAAELYEVARPSYPKLAEMLGEPPPSKRDLDKNDHPKVRSMVERGRDIMVRAFGEDGLQELIEAMKEQRKRWESLDESERWLERLSIAFSERYGLPLERARKVTEYYVQVRAGSSNTTIPEACRTIAAEWGTLRDIRL
jgi:hypothetical protein